MGPVSSFAMVTVEEPAPISVLTGLESATVKRSSGSTSVSPRMGTTIGCVVVPGGKDSVPPVAT